MLKLRNPKASRESCSEPTLNYYGMHKGILTARRDVQPSDALMMTLTAQNFKLTNYVTHLTSVSSVSVTFYLFPNRQKIGSKMTIQSRR